MIFKSDNKDKIKRYIDSLNTKYVEVLEYKATRSNNQNRLYWEIIKRISDKLNEEEGISKSDLKEALHNKFKSGFLGVNCVKIGDEYLTFPKSTKKLTTDEFGVYLEKVMIYANSINVELPNLRGFDV